jgi:ABC-type transporter Mla MlaB component
VPFSITNGEGRQILTLEGAVTIRDAQGLLAMAGESLNDSMPVHVNVAGLEDIDTCILQFLCSLRKTVPEVTFDNMSDAFGAALDRVQLRRALLDGKEAL